ncbi:MAG: FlgD immunoglobulin-like domain containing protein [FCB group bacterium]|jgi:flagellar basal-body rod modification protein FlgD
MTTSVTNITNTSNPTPATTTATNNGQISKDEFLQLLTYQLKSQDPLQPYNNEEFAAQLAQFSQLEQLTNISSLIQQEVASNQSMTQTIANSALPGLLGKNAKAISNNIFFGGTDNVALGYNLTSAAGKANIVIKDSSGTVVRTMTLSGQDLTSGDHDLTWDGKDNNGKVMPSGKYTFTVNATDGQGAAMTPTCYTSGKIQGVKFKSDGTVLVINGMEVPLQDVEDITL